MEKRLIGSVWNWLGVWKAVAHVDDIFYAEAFLDALAILISGAAPGSSEASSPSPVDSTSAPAAPASL
jgi:hypothetical protein